MNILIDALIIILGGHVLEFSRCKDMTNALVCPIMDMTQDSVYSRSILLCRIHLRYRKVTSQRINEVKLAVWEHLVVTLLIPS